MNKVAEIWEQAETFDSWLSLCGELIGIILTFRIGLVKTGLWEGELGYPLYLYKCDV